MKRIIYLFLILTLMTHFSCTTPEGKTEEAGYHPETPVLSSNKLSPEVLWKFGRIGGETVSPDQTRLLYSVRYYNVEEDKGFSDLYVYNFEQKTTTRITDTRVNESSAAWMPDGDKIAFISSESGSSQLWEMNADGTNRKQISFFDQDISGFKYSPNGKKVVFTIRIKLDDEVNDLYADLPKANARIHNDLMHRHWDSWHDFKYNHLFIADYNEAGIHEAKDIMEGEKFDSPSLPYGGMEEAVWTPDSKTLAYCCKKKVGKEYSFSTNSEIWFYDLETSTTKNMTEGLMGYDLPPTFSPDGKYMAWGSMKRDGYESDQARLMVMDLSSGSKTNLFKDFEESAHSITWSKDGQSIYFISDIQATDEIFSIDVATQKITRITNGIHNYKSLQLTKDGLLAQKVSMSQPAELYTVDTKTGNDLAVTEVNKPILDQIEMGRVEKRWIKTTDNKDMLVWVIYPPGFDPNKKYPTLLYCQGGPQGTVSQFWSYRWNFQLMAANDYIIVAPNRRGLPGFGMEWLEQISKDYGGQNMKDYLSAIDAVAEEPYVDETRLGAVGASYGGYSVFYLAGHHEKRFKAFVSHCGIFNFEQMYSTTEEMWFVDWDLGGAYWDKNNKVAQRSYSFSPHKYVDNWDTPILVIHGQNDFRIPYTQGMAAFNTAIMKGVPAEFLFYHDENHWVLKPQNGLLWHRTYFKWLDKWLKE